MVQAQNIFVEEKYTMQKRKRGNPRPRKLDVRVCVSFRNADLQILKDRATLSDMPLAEYIRELVSICVSNGAEPISATQKD